MDSAGDFADQTLRIWYTTIRIETLRIYFRGSKHPPSQLEVLTTSQIPIILYVYVLSM